MLGSFGFQVQMFPPSSYQGCTIVQDVFGGFFVLFSEPALCIRGQTRFGKVMAARVANKEVKVPPRQ